MAKGDVTLKYGDIKVILTTEDQIYEPNALHDYIAAGYVAYDESDLRDAHRIQKEYCPLDDDAKGWVIEKELGSNNGIR
jgi:hypothetical protein